MEALSVAVPAFELLYDRRDVTIDVSPLLTAITYTDNLDGEESDSLELTLEDADGRWWQAWYPRMGDRLTLRIGYAGQTLVDCGDFEIDEIEFDGPPSTVRLRALAAGVRRDMRTHRGEAYENTTLAGIAQAVAARHKLRMVGEIEPIPVVRVTQLHEQDLAFLKRLAKEYGHAFNVRGDTLVFHRLASLRAAPPVTVLRMGDLTRYTFRDKVKGTPKSAQVAYHDPESKTLLMHEVDSDGAVVAEPSADALKLNTRVESSAQAEAKATAALQAASDEATTGTLSLWGNPALMAGSNVLLEGFGRIDGRYQIAASRHDLGRGGGYSTEIEVRRTRLAAAGGAT